MRKPPIQITYEIRKLIEKKIREYRCAIEIARETGLTNSAISREIKRNGGRANYNAEKAQENADEKRQKSITRRTKIYETIRVIIFNKLEALQMQIDILTDTIKEMRKK